MIDALPWRMKKYNNKKKRTQRLNNNNNNRKRPFSELAWVFFFLFRFFLSQQGGGLAPQSQLKQLRIMGHGCGLFGSHVWQPTQKAIDVWALMAGFA